MLAQHSLQNSAKLVVVPAGLFQSKLAAWVRAREVTARTYFVDPSRQRSGIHEGLFYRGRRARRARL